MAEPPAGLAWQGLQDAGSLTLARCARCRQMLLEFYAASGDFTRRLTSIRANAKFSAPDAGPEDYYSVSARRSAARAAWEPAGFRRAALAQSKKDRAVV